EHNFKSMLGRQVFWLTARNGPGPPSRNMQWLFWSRAWPNTAAAPPRVCPVCPLHPPRPVARGNPTGWGFFMRKLATAEGRPYGSKEETRLRLVHGVYLLSPVPSNQSPQLVFGQLFVDQMRRSICH